MEIRVVEPAVVGAPELRESSLPLRADVPLPFSRKRNLFAALAIHRHCVKIAALHVENLFAFFREAQLCFASAAREPLRFLAIVADAPNVAL